MNRAIYMFTKPTNYPDPYYIEVFSAVIRDCSVDVLHSCCIDYRPKLGHEFVVKIGYGDYSFAFEIVTLSTNTSTR